MLSFHTEILSQEHIKRLQIQATGGPLIAGEWNANYDGLIGLHLHYTSHVKIIPLDYSFAFHSNLGETFAQNSMFSLGASSEFPLYRKINYRIGVYTLHWREQLAFSIADKTYNWKNNGWGVHGKFQLNYNVSKNFQIQFILQQFHNQATNIGLSVAYSIIRK